MDTNKMMPEAMKSEFEAAFRQVFGFGATEAIAAKDDTAMAIVGAAAWAWQASREAVVVELPEQRAVPDRDCWARTNGLGFNNALKESRQMIEVQGLKVAP